MHFSGGGYHTPVTLESGYKYRLTPGSLVIMIAIGQSFTDLIVP
jgi:hypothetical protein